MIRFCNGLMTGVSTGAQRVTDSRVPCALGIESCLVSGTVLPAFYPRSQVTLLPRGVGGIIPILLLPQVSVALVECMLRSRKGWLFMQERKSIKISHSNKKYISWMESNSVILQWDYYGIASSELCHCFLCPFLRAVLSPAVSKLACS